MGVRQRPRAKIRHRAKRRTVRKSKGSLWVHQLRTAGLGNFVMLTPTLKAMSEMRSKRVPVFFETEELASIYKKCSFIEILSKRPPDSPIFTSRPLPACKPRVKKCRKAGESDSKSLFRIFCLAKGYEGSMPSTYVDKPEKSILTRRDGCKYVAIFHGCLGRNWLRRKRLPSKILAYMVTATIESGCIPVMLGSRADEKRFWSKADYPQDELENYLGKLSLGESISMLSGCDFFLSNDTGLYHVSGALGIPGLVLWHRTDSIKNRSPSKRIQHFVSKEGNIKRYRKTIKKYLDKRSYENHL